MEHRWGQRFAVGLPATIHLLDGAAVPVTMRDVSSGGAYVEVPAGQPALRGRVELEFQPSQEDATLHWRAWVIRAEEGGAGLMFDEGELASRLMFLAARRRRSAWRA
jgi:hypothetical protein